jgi:copper transport protein
MRRPALALGAALVVLAAAPQAAQAHAYLVRSFPANSSVLEQAPRSVRLVFSDSIRPTDGNAVTLNGGGSVLEGPPRVDPANHRDLVLPLLGGLANGDYTVRWRVLSDDGHTLEGLLAFGIGSGRGPPRAELPLIGSGLDFTNVVGRGLFLLGVLGSLGVVTFGLLVWRPAMRDATLTAEERTALEARAAWTGSIVLFSSFLVSQLGSVLAILHATTDTRYGRVHELAIVFAGIGAAATATSARPMRVLAAAAAVGLATTPSLAGHALDPGEPQALSFAADLVHVWAAAVWLGGLFALALSLREMRRVVPGARERLSALVARRFSRVALAAVLLIAASGLGRALVELTSVQQLWELSYGRAILVKTGLLVALLVVAWINRFRLVPRLAAGGSTRAERQLGGTALAELALLLVVLGAVAVLTDLRPGRTFGHGSTSPAVTSFPLR